MQRDTQSVTNLKTLIMEATQSDKPKNKRLSLTEQELYIIYQLLIKGSFLMENNDDAQKKSYRSLFDKVKKHYI